MENEPGSLEASWRAAGVDLGSVRVDARGTLCWTPPQLRQVDGGHTALLPLPSEELELGELLGRGGQGDVHSARQRSLGREVAVKVLRAEGAASEASSELLREARVAGALEHPNVVPVHLLGQSPEGVPFIVMKRVEGEPWSARLSRDRGAPEFLETHLEVLLDVCDAVAFAHTRGVLHRDIKPDNVMLGRFGEVYLLDWGLAVGLPAHQVEGLTLAAETHGIAGTPGYLAPEMAAADGGRLGPWSDVYLLGAVLHEILTGRPRHEGGSLLETCANAFRSAPFSYDTALPRELTAICARATHREIEGRYPDVGSLRDALRGFLRHRASVALAADARTSLESARAAGDGEQRAQLLTEARFGFAQALLGWPGNDEARQGRQEATRLLAERALDRRDLDTARALLAELEHGDRELDLRAEEAQQALIKRARALERLELEVARRDPRLGARERALAGWGTGAVVLAFHAVAGVLDGVGFWRVGYLEYLALSAVGTAAASGLMLPIQRRLLGAGFNRHLVGSLLVVAVAFWVMLAIGAATGVPAPTGMGFGLAAYGSQIALIAVLVEPKVAWVVPPVVVGAVATLVWPSLWLFATGLAIAATYCGGALLWGRPQAPERSGAPR